MNKTETIERCERQQRAVDALLTGDLVGAVVNAEKVLTLAEFIRCGLCARSSRRHDRAVEVVRRPHVLRVKNFTCHADATRPSDDLGGLALAVAREEQALARPEHTEFGGVELKERDFVVTH